MEKSVRVLVAGSRNYSDYGSVGKGISITINELANLGVKEITFMQGGCEGADEHAIEFINKTQKSIFQLTGVNIKHVTYSPNYNKYGSPAALHIRNQEMIDQQPVKALIFLEPGEPNNGTRSVVKRLEKAKIPFTPYGATWLLDSAS